MNSLRPLLALCALLQALPVGAEQLRVLRACGHPFYPPVSWHANGELTGMAPAVTRQLFAELGYRVELNADSNWKRCLQEVRHGNADIVVAAYRTDDRARWLSFTDQPIITDAITLFVNSAEQAKSANSEDITGNNAPVRPEREAVEGLLPENTGNHTPAPISATHLSPLRDRTVGLLLGDSFGDRFDSFVQAHSTIEYVSRGQQNFAKLALGRIDYMPLGRLSGHLQSRKLGYDDRIHALPGNIATEYYYLAVGQHSGLQHLLPRLNQRLAEMQRDGSLGRLVRRYSLQYLDQP